MASADGYAAQNRSFSESVKKSLRACTLPKRLNAIPGLVISVLAIAVAVYFFLHCRRVNRIAETGTASKSDSSRSSPAPGGDGIGVDKIGDIRRAYFEQQRSIKEIVRTLSVSRATVRKVVRGHATAFKYERGVQPTPKLGDC